MLFFTQDKAMILAGLFFFIIMIIPFRCATGHKRDMKSECGHAAFKNMC